MSNVSKNSILRINDLNIEINDEITAIKNISFDVIENEVLTILGEIDSGKTTLAKSLIGKMPISIGSIYFQESLAFGNSPNLLESYKIVKNELDQIFYEVEISDDLINSYFEEYNRRFYKFVENKFYDIKSKKTVKYNSKIKNSIDEGLNLKDFQIFSKKEDAKLKQFETSLENILEKIYIITDRLRSDRHFLRYLKTDEIVNLDFINKLSEKLSVLEKSVKSILNCVWNTLQEIKKIWEIKTNVNEGKYTSINLFFKNIFSSIDEIIKQHTQISEIDSSITELDFFISSLLAPKYKSKRIFKIIDGKIDKSLRSDEVYELAILKELMQMENIQKSISSFSKYQLPNGSELKELKKFLKLLSQRPEHILIGSVIVDQILNEAIEYNYKSIKKNHLKQQLEEWILKENPSFFDNKKKPKLSKKEFVEDLKNFVLSAIGFDPTQRNTYLDQLSDADKQRIYIALSIINPLSVMIFDESISLLDPISKTQIFNLLLNLKSNLGITLIFFEKDPIIAKAISDRVGIMYNGKLLELAPTKELFNNPLHPYTKTLFASSTEDFDTKVVQYNPKEVHYDYEYDIPKWIEISRNHFVLANARETTILKKSK